MLDKKKVILVGAVLATLIGGSALAKGKDNLSTMKKGLRAENAKPKYSDSQNVDDSSESGDPLENKRVKCKNRKDKKFQDLTDEEKEALKQKRESMKEERRAKKAEFESLSEEEKAALKERKATKKEGKLKREKSSSAQDSTIL